MGEAWIPVLFAAVIVVGVVGGSLAQMVLKELLPLLRNLAEQRAVAGGAGADPLAAEVEALRERLAHLEGSHQRLSEESRFLTRLLAERADGRPGPAERVGIES
jgi:hypothetical protein